MIKRIYLFVKSFFVKDLPQILKVFDKVHKELDAYIAATEAALLAAQAAAVAHDANLTVASNVKDNLKALTSTPAK